VLAAIALFMTGCGGTTQPAAVASPSPSPSPSSNATENTVGVANNPRYGQILVDGAGRTVYVFAADTGSASTCDETCAAIWPPYLASSPRAGTGAQGSLLGTTTRADGKVQVTYAGHPLYYFVKDKVAGDATGQAINGFGALWWVVAPSGAAITIKP
jgi:predicted lipoprotein with Yx(FWY)xxD motif